MSRNPSQNITAPSGMDITSDPVTIAENRAELLVNYLVTSPGKITANIRMVNQLEFGMLAAIDGVGWYYNGVAYNVLGGQPVRYTTDYMLLVSNGSLYTSIPGNDPLQNLSGTPMVRTMYPTGYVPAGDFFKGKTVRFVALESETVMVQDGGILPLRFYSDVVHGFGFYRAGIQPPVGTGTYANLILATSGVGLTGTYGYRITFTDERGRESSPSDTIFITLVNQGVQMTVQTGYAPPPTAYSGSNLATYSIYRNTQGAPNVFYRIKTGNAQPTGRIVDTFVAGVDTAADSTITAGVLCPAPGENDPPNAASIACVYKNRLFLNDVTDATVLQVSNTLSVTQFTQIPASPVNTSDGVRSTVGTDQGDAIIALIPFGSVLAIFKRRGCFYLSGDDLTSFSIQPMHEKGCIAPDSVTRCDNVIAFLASDGVYVASYQSGDVVQKVSKEIERELNKHSTTDLAGAKGAFVSNRYHLTVGMTMFIYDFDAQGWTTFVAGSGTIQPGGGLPDISNIVGVGFNLLQDSGLIGSVSPNEAGCNNAPPPGAGCDVIIVPSSGSIPGTQQFLLVQVIAQNNATIDYQSQAGWLSVSGPQNNSGYATVIALANPTCFTRVGTVTICGQVLTVTQDRSVDCVCMMTSVTPSSFALNNTGQTVTVNYAEVSAVTITYSASDTWLHPQAPSGGLTGTIDIIVDANTSCANRSGTVQICDKMVSISQTADPGCGCSVTIMPASFHISTFGDTLTSLVSAANGSVNTPVSADQTWLHIISYPASGSGSLVVTVDANPSDIARTGHVTLCNAVVTYFQAGGSTP